MQEQNTNFFPTVVYILQKNIWDEKRYSLSNDIPPEKVKTNPIIEARKIEALIDNNSDFLRLELLGGYKHLGQELLKCSIY